jgi:hypothetical protein
MARKVKTEKQKKRKFGKILLYFCVIVLAIGILGGTGYFVFKYLSKDDEPKKQAVEVVVLDSLDEYGYSLSDSDTDLFKEEYNVLKDILNEDKIKEDEFAKQVAKLFVIDLYTMSSKTNKLDVGGSEYFYLNKVSMFEKKVMDTLYANLLDNTYGDRKQELPEVNGVEVVSIDPMKYTVDGTTKDGFLVKLKWTYKVDMGYDSQGSVVLCKEDGIRMSVVDYQPTFNPKY